MKFPAFIQMLSDEKIRVLKLLTELDPANLNKYNKIKEDNSNNPRIK